MTTSSKPKANYFVTSIALAALIIAALTGWKVFSSPTQSAELRGLKGIEKKVGDEESAENDRQSAALTPEHADSAKSRAAQPSPLVDAPANMDADEATVRLPTVAMQVDKLKLEEEAFSVANGLVEARPKDPKAIHVAAVCNSQLNKTAEAQRLWLQCVELSPKVETYYLNLAANALFRGDTEFARSILEKAEANGLKSADLSHHMGLALSRLGEDERAVEVLRKAIDENLSSPAHWMLLGQSQLKLGQYTEAKVNLQKAAEQGVQNRALFVALMNCAVRLKQPEEAAKYRAQVEAMGDDTTTDGQQRFEVISEREARRVLIAVLAEASSVYRDAKMGEEAEMLALRLLTLEPANYGMCRFLTDLYHESRKVREELVVRQRMSEIAPSDLMNLLYLARCCADAGLPKKCEANLKLAIAISPGQAIGYAAMAEFLVEQRQAAQAKWYAEQALKREATPAGHKLLVSILRALGDETAAQQVEQNAAAARREK